LCPGLAIGFETRETYSGNVILTPWALRLTHKLLTHLVLRRSSTFQCLSYGKFVPA